MDSENPAKKRVKFSVGTIFTPQAQAIRNFSRSKFRRLWLERCQSQSYEQLNQDLTEYQRKGMSIRDFFSKEGDFLLRWSLINISSNQPLNFLCGNIPLDLVRERLCQENYLVIGDFLTGETAIEKYKGFDKQGFENRIKKIELLLDIDPVEVRKFLENSLNTLTLGTEVVNSVKQAITRFEAKNSPFA